MQVPARRKAGLVQPFAVKPETAAFGVLDPVIVAGRPLARSRVKGVFLQPPFGADAFGAVGAHHPVLCAAPTEHDRWVVRHRSHNLDRIGPGQKMKGARLQGPVRAILQGFTRNIRGRGQGRNFAAGLLGHMAGLRRQTRNIGRA